MVARKLSLRALLLPITGTLTLIIALLAAKDVYGNWQRLTNISGLRAAATSSDLLFDATEKLSVERDVALSMLHAPDSETIDNLRPRLMESRQDAEQALRATMAALDRYTFMDLAKPRGQIEARLSAIQTLRPRIDREVSLPKDRRDRDLPERWASEVTALILETENLWIGLVRYFTDIDPIVTQHLWFKHLLRTITDYTGRERSLVGQLITENARPTPDQAAQLLRGQGIVESSWMMSQILADQSGLYSSIAADYTDASSHYATMRDMIRTMVSTADGQEDAAYPISVDLWFELSTQASDSLGTLKDRSIAATRDYVETLIAETREGITAQLAILFVALVLCAYSFWIIVGRVIRPINEMVAALLGAIQVDSAVPVLPADRHDEIGKLAIVLRAFQQNVEAMRRTTRQLVQAQKMEAVGQLTGGIAHDFNNLLAVVILNLDLLEDHLRSNPKAREIAEHALQASLRGADLTRQLLAFSRRQTLEPTALSLNELVSGTTELLRRALGERVSIRMLLADDLAPALADQTQLESAIANLAINARDAMPEGGVLTIETANKHLDEQYQAENPEVTPGAYVMVAVSDTGTGMPREILDRVFEPFFSTKGEGKGSGLGLSMVYGFAKQSHGHVKIYSEVGHGTSVRLYLPRATTEIETQPEDMGDVNTPTENATILVVEDNDEVRRVVVLQLTELGYRVIEADNGAAALAILEQEQPIDLLFTDVVMPGTMTGDALAREATRLRPNLKVLYASGFAEASIQHGARSRNIGMHNLLSKPYRKQDLARRVREMLLGERMAS